MSLIKLADDSSPTFIKFSPSVWLQSTLFSLLLLGVVDVGVGGGHHVLPGFSPGPLPLTGTLWWSHSVPEQTGGHFSIF